MDQAVLNIFDVVLAAACSQVAVLIVVSLQVSIYGHGQRVTPDVELPVLVQKRPFTILLNNVGSLFSIDVSVANDLAYLAQLATDCYSTAPISVFAGFHYPKLCTHSWVLC